MVKTFRMDGFLSEEETIEKDAVTSPEIDFRRRFNFGDLLAYSRTLLLAVLLAVPGCASLVGSRKPSETIRTEEVTLQSQTNIRANVRGGILEVLATANSKYVIIPASTSLSPSERDSIQRYLLNFKEELALEPAASAGAPEPAPEAAPPAPSPSIEQIREIQLGGKIRVISQGRNAIFYGYADGHVLLRFEDSADAGQDYIFPFSDIIPREKGIKIQPPAPSSPPPHTEPYVLKDWHVIFLQGNKQYDAGPGVRIFRSNDLTVTSDTSRGGADVFREVHIGSIRGHIRCATVRDQAGRLVKGPFLNIKGDPEGSLTRFPPGTQHVPERDRVSGSLLELLQRGEEPRLLFGNNFYVIDEDSPVLPGEIVYASGRGQLVTVITRSGSEIPDFPSSRFDRHLQYKGDSTDEDSEAVRQFIADRWYSFKQQLAIAGIDTSDFPTHYPEIISSGGRQVPLKDEPVILSLDETNQVELGRTDTRGNLGVILPDVLTCETLGKNASEKYTLHVGQGSQEISADTIAKPLMSADEMAVYQDHLVTAGEGGNIGPSLRYLDRFPNGCMAGRVRAATNKRLAEVFQGTAEVVHEKITLPLFSCEGEPELRQGEKFFFRHSPEGFTIVTPDGRCKGVLDTPPKIKVVECFGPNDEKDEYEAMKQKPEYRGLHGRWVTEDGFLSLNHSFLRKYPFSCRREEIINAITDYLQKNEFKSLTLPRDATIYFAFEPSGHFIGYSDSSTTLGRGTQVFIREAKQDPMRAHLAEVIFGRKKVWWVTTPDGGLAGYTTSLELFGVDEESPIFWRDYAKLMLKLGMVGYASLKALGLWEVGMQGVRESQERLRTEKCQKSCEYEYGNCLKCARGELFGCEVIRPRGEDCDKKRNECRQKCR